MKTISFLSKSTLAILLAGGLIFTGCQKNQAPSANTSSDTEATYEASKNDAEAEAAFDDVFNNSMGVSKDDAGDDISMAPGVGVFDRTGVSVDGRIDSTRCFTVTVDNRTPGSFPKTVTIDFGDGCVGRDGKLRKGKIITVFTGPMFVPGNKATTTLEGYYVDSIHIEGTHTVANNSTSSVKIFTVTVAGGKISTTSGRWIKWESTKTISQVEGLGTPLYPMDDVFTITGSTRGENVAGNSWSAEVMEPLVKKFTCRWIVKGVVKISKNTVQGILDYGSGDCDNKATITVNGNVRVITLP